MMTNQPLRAVLLDDDPVDLWSLQMYVQKHAGYTIAAGYSSADEMLSKQDFKAVDVLFSDIQMVGTDGLAARRLLKDIEVCVFVTSHPEYALESFEVEAFDFITKPIVLERFMRTISRINDYFTLKQKASLVDHQLGSDCFYIKEGHTQYKINFSDILYLEALKDYTRIITSDRKYTVLSNLGSLLKTKEFSGFLRVHRSYAVQKHFVSRYDHKEVEVGAACLPVGRAYRSELQALVK